jgi:hypothetical protein
MWLADILYSTDAATEADFGVIWAAGNDLSGAFRVSLETVRKIELTVNS